MGSKNRLSVDALIYFFFRSGEDEESFRGKQLAPWVPTRAELIPYIMKLAKVGKGDVFYDLGCGDGRVVIEAVKRGAKGVCVDINPDLINEAKLKAKAEGVYDKIKFINTDFFNVSLQDATVIYMYLLTFVNALLRDKLEKETREGTRIVTLDFEIPLWTPIHKVRIPIGYRDAVIYLYIRGKSDKP